MTVVVTTTATATSANAATAGMGRQRGFWGLGRSRRWWRQADRPDNGRRVRHYGGAVVVVDVIDVAKGRRGRGVVGTGRG